MGDTVGAMELVARLEAMAARLDDLEAENAAQRAKNAGLEARIAQLAARAPMPATSISGSPGARATTRRGLLRSALAAGAAITALAAARVPTAEAGARSTFFPQGGTPGYGMLVSDPASDDPADNLPPLNGTLHVLIATGSAGARSPDRNCAVLGTAANVVGVQGLSGNGTGVYAASTNNTGVLAKTDSASLPAIRGDGQGVGILGTATGSGMGLWGASVSGIALLGTSTTGIGLSGSTADNNVGVFGSADGPGKIGAIGLVGRSAAGTGVVGQGATAARFDGPVVINGSLTLTGGAKSAAVPHPDGVYRRMYCVEATESWFEDFGIAELRGGRATVDLDPEFDAVVKGDDYRVFLTEIGDCGGLYVSRKAPHRFEVRSRTGAGGTFDYRLAARRRDIEGKRLERVVLRAGKLGEPLKLPDLPIPARAPDLPEPARSEEPRPR